MLLGYFLSLAAASHALTTPKPKDSAHLIQRNGAASCSGGRFFSGWFDEAKGILPGCKCPNGLVWDDDQEQCLFPALPKPKAGPGEKVICAQTADKYISYGNVETALPIHDSISTDFTGCSRPGCRDLQLQRPKHRASCFPQAERNTGEASHHQGMQKAQVSLQEDLEREAGQVRVSQVAEGRRRQVHEEGREARLRKEAKRALPL